MKKTRIKVRAYCSEFDIEVSRKENYLGVEEAEKHIRKEIVDTAQVISVTFLEEKEKTFNNTNYKDPDKFIKTLNIKIQDEKESR